MFKRIKNIIPQTAKQISILMDYEHNQFCNYTETTQRFS